MEGIVMRLRNSMYVVTLLAFGSLVGCQSKPMVVVDINRVGEGSDRIDVQIDRSNLKPADIVYVAQENLGPGHDRLTLSPESKSMVHGDIRVRVIVESVGPATHPTLP